MSTRPGVSHGSILCPQTQGNGFPQPAPTGQTVVIEKIKNGIVLNNTTKKISKSKNPEKNRKIIRKYKRNKHSYRGRGGQNGKLNSFSVLLVNLRGYKSKEMSLKKLIKRTRPSLVAMNETLLSGNMKVSMPPYTCWSKNRSEKGGGGISTAVSPQYKDFAVGAGQGEEEDEYLITRFDCFSPALNVINCYGEQRKTIKEEVNKKWIRLKSDMEKIRAKNEFCCLTGDLNKLVGNSDMGVPGNHPEVSLGGRLLLDLLETRNWILVNSMGQEVVEGGPFTRKDPATGNLSCLDMFIVSRELSPYVQKLHIDSERKIPIARAVRTGSTYQLVYSDHYTCLLTLTGLPRVREGRKQRKTVWNLGREGGWENYRKLTEEYKEAFENAIREKESIEEKMNNFERLHDKIKFKAFGKVTIGNYKEPKNDNDETEDITAHKLFEEEF